MHDLGNFCSTSRKCVIDYFLCVGCFAASLSPLCVLCFDVMYVLRTVPPLDRAYQLAAYLCLFIV